MTTFNLTNTRWTRVLGRRPLLTRSGINQTERRGRGQGLASSLPSPPFPPSVHTAPLGGDCVQPCSNGWLRSVLFYDTFVTDESKTSLERGTFLNLHQGARGPAPAARLGAEQAPGTGFRACPSSLAPPLPSQGLPCPAPSYLTFTGKVLDGHVLDGNLLEEEWLLAPGVPADDPPLPQPLAEPGQVAVAVEGVGQEVSARRDGPCLSGSLLLWERPQAPVLQRPRGPALRAGLLRGQRDGSGKRDADSLLKSGRSLCERERVPFQTASSLVLPHPPCLLSSSCASRL